MLTTVLLDSFHFANFKWQQDRIAATLCENRDMPELHCDGNCYFAKQVRKRQQQQQAEYPGLEDRLTLKVIVLKSDSSFDTSEADSRGDFSFPKSFGNPAGPHGRALLDPPRA